jgi:hypothetical protein
MDVGGGVRVKGTLCARGGRVVGRGVGEGRGGGGEEEEEGHLVEDAVYVGCLVDERKLTDNKSCT